MRATLVALWLFAAVGVVPLEGQGSPVPQGTVSTAVTTACPTLGGWDRQGQLAREPDARAWIAFMERVGCRRLDARVPIRVAPVPGTEREDVVCIFYAGDRSGDGWPGCLVTGRGGVLEQ